MHRIDICLIIIKILLPVICVHKLGTISVLWRTDRQGVVRPTPCWGVTKTRITTPPGTPTETRGSYPGQRGNCSGQCWILGKLVDIYM